MKRKLFHFVFFFFFFCIYENKLELAFSEENQPNLVIMNTMLARD